MKITINDLCNKGKIPGVVKEGRSQIVSNAKGGDKMLLVIDKKETGINLRKIMDERGFSVKDIQQYL